MEALLRERERCRQSANAGAGDDDGLRTGQRGLYCSAERLFRQGAFRGPRSARIEAGIVPEQG